MDTTRISQFLSSLSSVGFFKRAFGWKKILADARMAQDSLGTISTQYSQDIASLQATIQHSAEEANHANYNYKTALDDKRQIENRLSQSEARERECLAKIDALRGEKEEVSGALQFEQAGRASLKEENANLKEEKVTLTEKYDKLFADYQSAQGEIASNKIQAENATAIATELSTLKETHAKLNEDFNASKQELALAKQSIEQEQAKVSSLQDQIKAITAEKDAERERTLELQKQIDNDSSKFNDLKENYALTTQQLETERTITAKLKQDLTTITAEKQQEHDCVIELEGKLTTASAAADEFESKYETANKELQTARDDLTAANTRCDAEAAKYADLKADFDANLQELTKAKNQIAADERVRDEQTKEYQRNVAALNTLADEQRNMKRELEEREEKLREEHNEMLATAWKRHEQDVELYMHELANKYDFTLCDKNSYPYKGIPDNAFFIGDMFTIFDAKSPKNPEDLGNFPTYLKEQAEKMEKYCKHDKVRKEAFLVVPVSTLEALNTFIYPMAEYTVYVITPEAVLPILQMLKVLETYDFAEQLSPDERAAICRLIGRLSHTAKRKIQVDNFMSREMISVLQGVGSLPEDFVADVDKYEKEAILNPPIERRAKVIQIKSVADEVDKIYNESIGLYASEQ